ncbi:MAG: CBS domain-containing protein [Acidobacteriales bacterium]|nr:CBS domain-containing protein [Terriglobales bacterium]
MNFLRTWSFPLGKWFGVDVRLHAAFGFLLIFILAGALDQNGAGARKGLMLFGSICLAVVLHEIGHLLAVQTQRLRPRLIMLLPIGGVHLADQSESAHPPAIKDEVLVSLSGPLANLMVGLGAALVITLMRPEGSLLARPWLDPNYVGKSFVWVNLYLAALSLIPAYPLDGGRILRAVFAHAEPGDANGNYFEATRRVVTTAHVFSTVLIFSGIWNPWLMLIGFFLFIGVQIEDRSLLFQTVMESVKLDEVMLTEFSTLSPADTLRDALEKAVHTLQDDFPVVRGGDLVGVISKQNILEALRDEGDGYVQSAMKKAFTIAGKNEPLSAVFRKISSGGPNIIPVVENEHLVGIVTLQNLMRSLGLVAESRRLQKESEE